MLLLQLQKCNILAQTCFIEFHSDIKNIEIPSNINFPFNYEPHKIAKIAASELQEKLASLDNSVHKFGNDDGEEGLGKMFGVLVVKNREGTLGYLAAFSGKLSSGIVLDHFVPPVYDMLDENGFYRKGEDEISAINKKIIDLENDIDFLEKKSFLENEKIKFWSELEALKAESQLAKKIRAQKRNEDPLGEDLNVALNNESSRYHYLLKDKNREVKASILHLDKEMESHYSQINQLKALRREMSNILQQQLFDKYTFLNLKGEEKSLKSIFKVTQEEYPPSGAGECAAPKLLQYAFKNEFFPIALAEFWWGKSPSSEIRKHGSYYSACRGKCGPILPHMLYGLPVDEDPIKDTATIEFDLEIIFEDDYLLAINKPHGILSIPGKSIEDSIYSRLAKKYPQATGPLVVHRLDFSTSGLMLVAKTKEIHQNLQAQFIKKKIRKRYVAIVDGVVKKNEGMIDLPIRVDLNDRPRQLVCFEYGKPAQTIWKKTDVRRGKTRLSFFPVTGRTHQLRVHAAHPQGLGLPIVGDDLYGVRNDRLYLHAEEITFWHPILKEEITLTSPAPF